MARGPHFGNVLRDLPAASMEIPALLWRRYGAKIPAPAFYKRNAARRYGLAYHAEQAPRPKAGSASPPIAMRPACRAWRSTSGSRGTTRRPS